MNQLFVIIVLVLMVYLSLDWPVKSHKGFIMKKRYKMDYNSSKRKFKRNTGVNRMNVKPRPMRGGTRL